MERPDAGPPPLPPPLPAPQALPLRYTTQLPRPPLSFPLRMMLGFFGYLGVSAAWIVMALRLRLRPDIVWTVWIVMTGGLLALAFYLRVRYRFSGFGYGILTALLLALLLILGLVLLVIGMCFKGLTDN